VKVSLTVIQIKQRKSEMAKKINNRKADNKKSNSRKEFLSGLHFETLEKRELLAGDLAASFAEVAEGEGGLNEVAFSPDYRFTTAAGYLTGTNTGKAPLDVALEYFGDNAQEYNVAGGQDVNFELMSSYTTPHTRVTHIVLQQMHNGLPVEGSMAQIAVDNNGQILSAGSAFLPGLVEDGGGLEFAPTVSAIDAYASVVSAVGGTIESSPGVTQELGGISQGQIIDGGGASDGPASAALKYRPNATGGVDLVWIVGFKSADSPSMYYGAVNAETGQVQNVFDMAKLASYNDVFPSPGQSPEDISAQTVGDEAVDSIASPFGWHDTNGIPGPEFTDTRGNNVHVQEGALGSDDANATGARAEGGDELVFNQPYNELEHHYTPENVLAQTVQGFYTINMLHDVYYRYGFNEAAGNYQSTNYTGQGVGGDHLLLHVNDPDSAPGTGNEAYFMPDFTQGIAIDLGVDGQTGTISVGELQGSGAIARGIAMDNDVVLHEHGHAVFGRLVGGPDVYAGVTINPFADQQSSMNEGFADYTALWHSLDVDTTTEVGEPLAEYATNNPLGIRRVVYSHDLSVNPLTFDDYNPDISDPNGNGPGAGVINSEIHNAGEIWASALYDMTWELMFKYGGVEDEAVLQTPAFNPNLYDSCISAPAGAGEGVSTTSNIGFDYINYDTGANNLSFQLVMDALALQPVLADFVEGRDAILAADVALTGGVNHDAIWTAFARRGLGYGADAINVLWDEVDSSFDMPPTNAHIAGVAYVDADLDGQVDVGEARLQDVTMYIDLNDNGTHETLEPWVITDENGEYKFDLYVGGAFSIKALPKDGYLQTTPATTSAPGEPLVDGGFDIYVTQGVSQDGINFGFTSADNENGIYGTKFNDVNDNGVQDPSETGIEGIYVYIDANEDGRIGIGERAAITDENGDYFIPFGQPENYPPLASGTYQVREVVKHGWAQTTDEFHEVLVAPGISIYDIDFGNKENRDYGDAPESYDGDNPASAGVSSDFMLGTAVDAEANAQNTIGANGDDNAGSNDEQGVSLSVLAKGVNATASVVVTAGNAQKAILNGWVDFNRNGVFDSSEQLEFWLDVDGDNERDLDDPTTKNVDEEEHLYKDIRLGSGEHDVRFKVPNTASVENGVTYARFRLGVEAGLNATGPQLFGEIEDLVTSVVEDQPIAVDDVLRAVEQDSVDNKTPYADLLANDLPSTSGAVSIQQPSGNPFQSDEGGTVYFNQSAQDVVYAPAPGFTGSDTFTYSIVDPEGNTSTATVSVYVNPRFDAPEAVDDYEILANSSVGAVNILDVVANDVVGDHPPLTIASFTQPAHGRVEMVDGQLQYIREDSNAFTLDSFRYTVVGSASGLPASTATVTVQLNENTDTVEYIVEACPNPGCDAPFGFGASVEEGNEFTIRVSVMDSRTDGVSDAEAGVYAAYVDMLYDADFLRVVPNSLVNSSIFPDITSGKDSIPGIIDEAGGVQDGVDQTTFDRGRSAMSVFEVRVEAIVTTNGEQTFLRTDPANASPLHDTVVIAPSPASIPALDIKYGFTALQITSDGSGEGPLDVNSDGAITPLDALNVINDLNAYGSREVAEGETVGLDRAMDVNRDSFVSPLDALAIINYLNENTSEMGEGEAVQIIEQSTIDTMIAGNEISATDAVSAEVIDEYLRVRENQIGLSYFTGGSHDVVKEDTSDLDSAIDELADDVFGQWK